MMPKWDNCFQSRKPDFHRDVTMNGERIATIHALTPRDMAYIERVAESKIEYSDGTPTLVMNTYNIGIAKIKRSLTGTDDSGWVFGVPVTDETVGDLDTQVFHLLLNAIQQFELDNDAVSAEKNLKLPSD